MGGRNGERTAVRSHGQLESSPGASDSVCNFPYMDLLLPLPSVTWVGFREVTKISSLSQPSEPGGQLLPAV